MALSTSRSRAARFHALDRSTRPALVRRLHRFFVGQARRVVEAYLAEQMVKAVDDPATQPPQAEELLPDSERNLLWLAMLPYLLQAILNALDMAGTMVGLTAVLETDPRVHRLLSEAQLRLAGVHAATLDAVRTTLAEGFSRGYSARQIAYGVPDQDYPGLAATVAETYAGRARTIATTEIAVARQNAALERYQEAGVATVLVHDGPGCQWETHNSGGPANGTVRTVIEAHGHPTAHPNCSRVFTPVR